jgi:amino acid transporter
MARSVSEPPRPAAAANRLREGALGVGAVTFFVVSAAGPLVAIAGGYPVGMMLGDGAGIPAILLCCMAILLVFAAGYTAMSRHVVTAGGFYAFAARGLGGIAGGAAALIAVIAYNTMQVGLYGMFGAAVRALLLQYAQVDLPWYDYSLLAVVCVAVLGYRQVDLSAKILSVLVTGEYLAVLILDAAILRHGGAHGITLVSFTPAVAFSGSPAIAILFCFASFMGFEATTIYGEEARDPERTIPRATYLSVFLIGAFYAFSLWSLVIGAGAGELAAHLRSLADPTRFLFEMSDLYVGRWLSAAMSVLFVTSVFAGLLAFHNAAARYFYALGREGVLPAELGRTHPRHSSPHAGSVVQTTIGAIVVVAFAASRSDPVLTLFSWMTNLATLGVIALMALASAAVLAYFRRGERGREGWLRTQCAPAIAGLALSGVLVLAIVHFDVLTGSTSWMSIALPAILPVAACFGALRAWHLRRTDLVRYRGLGFGVGISATPPLPPSHI